MPITDADIADLVTGTQKDLGRLKFQQIAQSLTDYEVFPVLFKKDRVTFDSGTGIQKTLMSRLPDVARHVGWTEEDSPSISDLLTTLSIPYRHATAHWSYKRQEMLMNRGSSRITDIIKARRIGALTNLVEVFENAGWTAPSTSGDDTEPYGFPYYLVKNNTVGFNGTVPSGHTYVAGVDHAVHTGWKNYTGQYVTVSKGDLIKKMRTMRRKTGFKPPVDADDYTRGKGMRYRIYMNEATVSTIEEVGESQNENLGRDIASLDGVNMAFRGFPLRYVPKLDADTTDPVYFIDHGTWQVCALAGDWMRETDPIRDPDKHDWWTVYLDCTYNFLCFDRRRNGVLNK
jgi:hypothetical protein